jgi:Protein of unknown function (DUF2946)
VRRLPTVLALLGCLIHAMVLPWYAASRSAAHSAAAALDADLAVICHGGAAEAAGAQSGVPQQPNGSGSDCPICKGLVGLQFALLATQEVRFLERAASGDLAPSADRGLISQIVFIPRNRGPPSLA